MPQIWLTDEEFGNELLCSPTEARAIALSRGWTRKKSRDGASRTLLPESMMIAFVLNAAQKLVASGAHVDHNVAMMRLLAEHPALPSSNSKAA